MNKCKYAVRHSEERGGRVGPSAGSSIAWSCEGDSSIGAAEHSDVSPTDSSQTGGVGIRTGHVPGNDGDAAFGSGS